MPYTHAELRKEIERMAPIINAQVQAELAKPRLFKRSGVWFCALPGEAGAVGPTMRDAWEWWKRLSKVEASR